jgi:hypothetical protein
VARQAGISPLPARAACHNERMPRQDACSTTAPGPAAGRGGASRPPAGAGAAAGRAPAPRTLDEVIGQAHLLGPASRCARPSSQGRLHSMILWGPPGVGKTTLARLMAGASMRVSSCCRPCCPA